MFVFYERLGQFSPSRLLIASEGNRAKKIRSVVSKWIVGVKNMH
jgi:hypothetical protein